MNKSKFSDPISVAMSCFLDRSQLVVLLQRILMDSVMWHKYYCCSIRSERCADIDKCDLEFMREFARYGCLLSKNIFAELGWTSYGAVALSWCEGARLEDVWSGWLTSGFPLKPLPEYERPARFLNPALVPQMVRLCEIVTWVNAQRYPDAPTYDLAIAAMIAGLKAPLVFDMAPEMMGAARPQVAAFLKSRMLQQASQSAEETRLIETWGATVKGSPYDIWETL